MRGRFACLLLALAPMACAADDGNGLGMSYVETADLKLVYFDPLGYLTPHAVRTFTNSLAWQQKMFGWTLSEPVSVLLTDFSDYGGGSAWAAPRNTVFIDIEPISLAFETYPSAERLYSTMNHELVHVATSDVASEEDLRWRRLFHGKVTPQSQNPESLLYAYLTVPRFNVPRWYLEGSAVFMETWMNGGIGRAQGGYDEMVFREMVRDGAHFYDPLGLASRGVLVDFQVGANAYLYGTRFFTWLATTYSPEKVVAWLRRDEGSERHYAAQFNAVFGLPLEQGWQQWIAFEREFQQRNLAKVREHPITPQKALRGAALGSISRTFYDESTGMLYGAFRTPGAIEHVGALNTRDGSYRRLADIKRAMLYRVSSFAYDLATQTAFFTNDNLAFRDLMSVDVRTGEQRMLLENARIGELAFNPRDRSLMGVRHANGFAVLVHIPYPYDDWAAVHTFPYGVVPTDLDISPDGRLLSASVNEVNADQFVRVWELDKLLAGGFEPMSEFRFGQSVPESFVFSRDGRYLFGSSYYTGVSNIFRYEVATGAVEAVSNAESGLFRPTPLSDGRLLALSYTSEGFVPVTIDATPIADVSAITFLGAELAKKHPVVTSWQVPPPSTVDDEALITARGPYQPWREISLRNAYPVLQGYWDAVGGGVHANFGDPLGFVNIGVTAAATNGATAPNDQRGHLDIRANYLNWRAELGVNRSDFYDLFGPTKHSLKGYLAKLGYDQSLIFDTPRKLDLIYDLAYYDQLATLPGAQNVETSFTRLVTGQVELRYTDVRRSLGAVDDEKGVNWAAVLTGNRVNGETVPQVRGSLDFSLAQPFAHSSIWSRTAVGAASGDRNNTVANFYFGGFGNNYVDDRPVKRYREYYAMPGFGLQEISGLSFAKQMIEWNLPPWVLESAGTPSLHLQWLRPAVFATALWTDPQNAALRTTYSNLGGQIDLRFSVLHWYEVTLSAGYAVGYRGSQRVGSEWMLSLKLL